MTGVDLLRPSRDGDQFHYRWAARQALQLLRPGSDLTAINVEGASSADPDLGEGEEVIDLAEYYGGAALAPALASSRSCRATSLCPSKTTSSEACSSSRTRRSINRTGTE